MFWAVLTALAVGPISQVSFSQQDPPVFDPEYVEVAAKRLLPEVKLIGPDSSDFQALVDKYSQEERDAQIKRMLPLDRHTATLNPITPVPFVFNKGGVKLYLPDRPVVTSSSLQAIIRGNLARIAPLGILQIGDRTYPATLQGEGTIPGRIHLALYDDHNKVVGFLSAPQETTIGVCLEVLLRQAPEDRYTPEYQILFTSVVLMNITAFLQE
jgi:hypothetical protein